MQKSKLLGVFGDIFLLVGFGMMVFLMAASSQQELIYSTYVEGQGCDIAVDSNGNAYVARFAGTKTHVDGNPGGISTLVSKIDAAGTDEEVWHTWIGGSSRQSHDRPSEIAIDSSGNIYIAGMTNSPDFLDPENPYQIDDYAYYLVMLSNNGDEHDGEVLFSTVFESYSGNFKVGVGVGGGFVYVAGSSDDKVTLTQFSQSGDPVNSLQFEWTKSFGGSGWDYGQSVAVDNEGNAYVTGQLGSSDVLDQNNDPVPFTLNGQTDVFVAKYGIDGTLLYHTTLGGNEASLQGNEELGFGIAVHEGSGRIYVTGRATSTDFPRTPGAVNISYNGGRDAFLAVLEPKLDDPNDYNLLYSTYLGGSNGDRGRSVAVDDAGKAYVSAWAGSSDIYTTPDAYKPNSNGNDAFLWVIDPGNVEPDSLISATYLGGTKGDRGRGIRVHSDGSVYMTGMTDSRDFPLSPNAYLDTPKGGFVSVFAWPIPNNTPGVTIDAPADGATFSSEATIDFEGSASDTEDGDLTSSINWNSNINGDFGTGGSLIDVSLNDGVHTITATVTDSGGKIGSASIEITVGTPPEPDTISVKSITYSLSGGKKGDKHLNIFVALDQSVLGAVVSIDLKRNGNLDRTFVSSTDSEGIVVFTRNNARSGTYTTVVTNVDATGYTWDPQNTPPNSYTK